MTKSLIITYNEADEGFLMILFKKFKIKTQTILEKDYGDEGVPAHVLTDIVEGLDWIKKVKNGEEKSISWESMMAELESEEEAVMA